MVCFLTVLSGVESAQLRHLRAPGDQEEVGLAHPVGVGRRQVEQVQLQAHLADVVVQPGQHEVADPLRGRGAVEVRPVLGGGAAALEGDWKQTWAKGRERLGGVCVCVCV